MNLLNFFLFPVSFVCFNETNTRERNGIRNCYVFLYNKSTRESRRRLVIIHLKIYFIQLVDTYENFGDENLHNVSFFSSNSYIWLHCGFMVVVLTCQYVLQFQTNFKEDYYKDGRFASLSRCNLCIKLCIKNILLRESSSNDQLLC